MRRKGERPVKRRFELRKALSLMTAVSIVVLVGAAASAVYLFLTGVSPAEAAALVALLVISVAALVVFLLLRRHFGRLSAEVSQAEDSISALEELNSTLRAQRHDFLNHPQGV